MTPQANWPSLAALLFFNPPHSNSQLCSVWTDYASHTCVDCSLHFEEITIDELVFHNFAVFAWQKYLLVALHKRSSLRIALESHREL